MPKGSGSVLDQRQSTLVDEGATLALGQALAQQLKGGGIVYLEGDLGAGKTTLSRGLVQALGHQGAVKSPTYTLFEPYELASYRVFHLDLYRLADPEELEFIGFRDLLEQDRLTPTIMLIEWPERGLGAIPEPDLVVELGHRPVNEGGGRRIRLNAFTERAIYWLGNLTIP